MIPRIYLDMDGVCCDFVTPALELFGSPLRPEDIKDWDMTVPLRVTEDEFWEKIIAAGSKFWRGFKEYPWFWELYGICRNAAEEVIFLTSPGRCPPAAQGKLEWLQARFGKHFKDWIFTPNKGYIRDSEGVLVDDSEKNCRDWHASAGGEFVLFPQYWNEARTFRLDDKSIWYTKGSLRDHARRYEGPQC